VKLLQSRLVEVVVVLFQSGEEQDKRGRERVYAGRSALPAQHGPAVKT
jgi:hypothetical protein